MFMPLFIWYMCHHPSQRASLLFLFYCCVSDRRCSSIILLSSLFKISLDFPHSTEWHWVCLFVVVRTVVHQLLSYICESVVSRRWRDVYGKASYNSITHRFLPFHTKLHPFAVCFVLCCYIFFFVIALVFSSSSCFVADILQLFRVIL